MRYYKLIFTPGIKTKQNWIEHNVEFYLKTQEMGKENQLILEELWITISLNHNTRNFDYQSILVRFSGLFVNIVRVNIIDYTNTLLNFFKQNSNISIDSLKSILLSYSLP